MDLPAVGQRYVSEREPELGLGVVASVDPGARRVSIRFPATNEQRLYPVGTTVLRRVRFSIGETITPREGAQLTVETVEDERGLLVYVAAGRRVPEDAISDVTSIATPVARFLAGQADPSEVFDLRWRTLQTRARLRQSDVRGLLGGRVQLIPHQFHILREVAGREVPRVLLADEVGLGKTIEACLIVQRLLAVGQARRVLILVPESLTHQWFVELLRRFNLWFSIYDEARCLALEASEPMGNPFAATQLALANLSFLSADERRGRQAIEAGWDMVVIDEAHHLAWTPEQPSAAYALAEQLAARTPGLLLLTATPTQLGLRGHFARLRLLDPDRYNDYDSFAVETGRYGAVAGVADRIVAGKPLSPAARRTLTDLFNRDPDRLRQHLDAMAAGLSGSAEALLRTLLDQYGPGRVMFRNTRAAMSGFPKRRFCPAPLPSTSNVTQLARIARELEAEESGNEGAIRYSFREDPRIDWLADFLRAHRKSKVLLICRSQRKVSAIDAALQERIKAKSAVFHEGLPLVQRDRNAAWFAEPDGAQLLLCSEIGSEGRNFQFAHHLVLFDLPLNPGLVEQRIGRLDRIGQTETIRIHVPYLSGSADECVVEWYHHGLGAFAHPIHGGEEYATAFRQRLLAAAVGFAGGGEGAAAEFTRLIGETAAFRARLDAELQRGRDRLLEIASFNPEAARRTIERIRAADEDVEVRQLLYALLDHFGVRIRDHEHGDVFLDPSHAYVEAFPSLPADGLLATFDRERAITREHLRFLSADHPLVGDAIDLLVDSTAGTTAFGTAVAKTPGLFAEAVFMLEPMADPRWHIDRFLAPTPVRIVVNARGDDVTPERDAATWTGLVEDADLHRFLEQPGFNADLLRTLVESAEARAGDLAGRLRDDAEQRAASALSAELERLLALQKVNDAIRPAEIDLAREKLRRTSQAITGARLRLDSLRVVLEGPAGR